jgi:hypothetical protein
MSKNLAGGLVEASVIMIANCIRISKDVVDRAGKYGTD